MCIENHSRENTLIKHNKLQFAIRRNSACKESQTNSNFCFERNIFFSTRSGDKYFARACQL